MNATTPLEVLLKYNGQVPRYTSYPPAPYFTQDPAVMGALEILDASNRIGPWNVSYYFHIPFCPKRCHFCGCHTEIGRAAGFIKEYLDVLFKEVDLLLPRIDPTRPVTQIHFGGGTPNAVPYAYLETLLDMVRARAPLTPNAEVAIECDPNLVTVEKIRDLARMGFNRVSFGIQDFNLEVLKAVNRRFPKVAPKELFQVAREEGFSGNNLDLIYGLPYQTPESFRETIEKAIDADPDRISLFPYAHVPWIKGHQNVLASMPMPDAATRLSIAWESRGALERAGYQAIGMDHFAKVDDELAIADRNGALHRNFQGYCPADRAGQVYGMGASAITQLHAGYLQNAKDLEDYRSLVLSGKLPWSGGYRMSPEDIAVRGIVNSLLCKGTADVDAICAEAGVGPAWKAGYLAGCRERLRPYQDENLATFADGTCTLVGHGSFASRSIAAAFDPMLTEKPQTAKEPRYSKAL